METELSSGVGLDVKILIYALNYAPELTGVGKFTGEMSEWLSQAGHKVRVVTSVPYYPEWKVHPGYSKWRYSKDSVSFGEVWRCPVWIPPKPSGFSRILLQVSFAVSSIPAMLVSAIGWHPDLVWTVVPSALSMPTALTVGRMIGAKTWLHVQDLEIDAAFELGFLTSPLLRSTATRLESFLIRKFDVVSSITQPMLAKLTAKGLLANKAVLFPNWVDTELIFPLGRPSAFRSYLNISDDCFVALYAGNLGAKQGLESLIASARQLASNDRIRIVICGNGAELQTLLRRASGMSNVNVLPTQPLNRLNELLNLADVHLLPQRVGAEDLVMPSKLGGMLASGRPVIAGVRQGTQIAREIAGAGIVVSPDDETAMAEAVELLFRSSELRLDMGNVARRRAVDYWSKSSTLQAFNTAILKRTESEF